MPRATPMRLLCRFRAPTCKLPTCRITSRRRCRAFERSWNAAGVGCLGAQPSYLRRARRPLAAILRFARVPVAPRYSNDGDPTPRSFYSVIYLTSARPTDKTRKQFMRRTRRSLGGVGKTAKWLLLHLPLDTRTSGIYHAAQRGSATCLRSSFLSVAYFPGIRTVQ